MRSYVIQINRYRINLKKKDFLVISYLMSILITGIVYLTGGTNKVYPNLMYIPITLAAITNGHRKAVVHALLSGLMVGPFMPLIVYLNEAQDPLNWITRVIIYVLVAFCVGIFAAYNEREYIASYEKERTLVEAQMSTIYAMVKLSECRDDDTGVHIGRVSELCKYLTCKLRDLPKYRNYITDDYIENIYKVCSLHDIGKVGIPDSILLKPGQLMPEELEIMKSHTTIGTNILREVQAMYPDNKFFDLAISIAQYHHEKWNGEGYPNRLAGETSLCQRGSWRLSMCMTRFGPTGYIKRHAPTRRALRSLKMARIRILTLIS